MTFSPFADNTASVCIGSLMVENGTDCIAVYGSVNITRDQQGLGHALALLAIALRAVQVLEGEKRLPAVLPNPTKPKMTPKPYE